MTTGALEAALDARGVESQKLSSGDIFFRRSDGQGMYLRRYDDGTYNWSQAGHSDTNAMDFTDAEHHTLEEVLRRVDDFLGLVVSGRIIIDTLGVVRRSMELGISRTQAEQIAAIARDIAVEMHESGMDAAEIRTRFTAIHEQLRRERLSHAS